MPSAAWLSGQDLGKRTEPGSKGLGRICNIVAVVTNLLLLVSATEFIKHLHILYLRKSSVTIKRLMAG